MIVLDTNVISELLRGAQRASAVRTWLGGLNEQPVTTVLNRAELLSGVALLPHGARRDRLLNNITRALSALDICLPFTEGCADAYAGIVAARRASGRPIATMDALIASVALVNRAGVATRDLAGFAGVGLRVVDPWSDH